MSVPVTTIVGHSLNGNQSSLHVDTTAYSVAKPGAKRNRWIDAAIWPAQRLSHPLDGSTLRFGPSYDCRSDLALSAGRRVISFLPYSEVYCLHQDTFLTCHLRWNEDRHVCFVR
jgi:hypothetical protein